MRTTSLPSTSTGKSTNGCYRHTRAKTQPARRYHNISTKQQQLIPTSSVTSASVTSLTTVSNMNNKSQCGCNDQMIPFKQLVRAQTSKLSELLSVTNYPTLTTATTTTTTSAIKTKLPITIKHSAQSIGTRGTVSIDMANVLNNNVPSHSPNITNNNNNNLNNNSITTETNSNVVEKDSNANRPVEQSKGTTSGISLSNILTRNLTKRLMGSSLGSNSKRYKELV